MSPFLKALGVGIGVFAASLLIMWLTTRILHRPFFVPFPRIRTTPVTTPTPTAPPLLFTS